MNMLIGSSVDLIIYKVISIIVLVMIAFWAIKGVISYLTRKHSLWYWKIDRSIELQEEILYELRRINGSSSAPQRSHAGTSKIECPSCNAPSRYSRDNYKCEHCGSKLI